MNLVVDFYKGLDTLNLIIFWGVIIVVILLLIFSIIIANKNKKLKQIIISKKYESIENNKNEEKEMDLPIKKQPEIIPTAETKNEELNEKDEIENTIIEEPEKIIEEEKKFIAEEHVMEYNKDLFSLSNIKKANEYKEEKNNYEESVQKNEIKMPTAPYQRNVLREMSLSQTSPIGIVKKENQETKIINKAKELQDTLLSEFNDESILKEKYEIKPENQTIKNETKPIIEKQANSEKQNFVYKKEINEGFKNETNHRKNYNTESYIEKTNPINNKVSIVNDTELTENEKYLKEVSKKLSEAKEPDSIDRTEYELKQEEEAIISYEELMKKKDSIKMIDEEEAVISIEELMQKKDKKDKIYNITEEEENDKFISELKNFRGDL